MKITVVAKADAGFSPIIGEEIKQGQEYTIDEELFSADLFNQPVTKTKKEVE